MKYLIKDVYLKTLKKAGKEVLSFQKGDYLMLHQGNYEVMYKIINYTDKTVIIMTKLDE